MGEKRKAPKGCYWRGKTLYGRFEVDGVEHRPSLRTDDAKVAAGRLIEFRDQAIAAVRFGDKRAVWKDAILAWGAAITGHAKPNTVKRYTSA